ncbi:MAG: preprotein translocase subunit SecG [Puniceicoccales bacterium]|jgi:protein translocase SecG subunit|nr:preprotein translocase subunit SecG [Puniceicoccales bacterium]
MYSFFSFLLTFILICASIFTTLVILMQRPSANSGMGSSLGGGAVESAFGSDTTKVLTKWTIGGIVTFFIVAFFLSMMQIWANSHKQVKINNIDLKNIIVDDDIQKQ